MEKSTHAPSGTPTPLPPDLEARFDTPIDRRATHSSKWDKYRAEDDVLPFWVADMDLPTPPFALEAVRERLNHPILGYTNVPDDLVDAFCAWLDRRYGWCVQPEWLTWVSGVVPGLETATRSVCEPADPLLLQPPVYYPFLSVPRHSGTTRYDAPLVRDGDSWVMDLDALRHRCAHTRIGRPRALLFCNPQNPTGRCFSRAELAALGDIAAAEDLVVISDEIHCELLLDKAAHVPLASLSDDLAQRTITLMAPSKTYNLPGLSCAVAIIPDAQLRTRFRSARGGMVSTPGTLAYAAATACYQANDDYLDALRTYLRRNRDRLAGILGRRAVCPEGTYLTWIDVRDLGLEAPGRWFEERGLGLSDGAPFGAPGFVRFNFGCSRPLLERGIERWTAALAGAAG
ncbi:MAG: PatB family C-S lyase [Pseudomonadota bacterium]